MTWPLSLLGKSLIFSFIPLALSFPVLTKDQGFRMARPRHRSNLPHPAVRREANQTRGEAAQLSQGAGDLIPACFYSWLGFWSGWFAA